MGGVYSGGRTGNGTECQNTPQKRTNQEIMIRTLIVTNQTAQEWYLECRNSRAWRHSLETAAIWPSSMTVSVTTSVRLPPAKYSITTHNCEGGEKKESDITAISYHADDNDDVEQSQISNNRKLNWPDPWISDQRSGKQCFSTITHLVSDEIWVEVIDDVGVFVFPHDQDFVDN